MQDVFISYKSEEYEDALWVRNILEEHTISCWMAPASIPGGSSYAEEIPIAIENSKVFVLILSSRSQASRWVKRELDMAIGLGKTVLPFMVERFELSRDFGFYLGIVQRYDAATSRMEAMDKMLQELRAILDVKEALEEQTPPADAEQAQRQRIRETNPELVDQAQELLARGDLADARMLFELGTFYENGKNGLPHSLKSAMECYEAAAKQAFVEAQYRLGLCYLAGERKSRGVYWLEQAANQEHMEAQYQLGLCYLDGIGINDDEEAGILWLSKAGKQGHLRACFRMGQLCEGNLSDLPFFVFFHREALTEAMDWYKLAAAQEDPEAYYRLGRLAAKIDRDEALNHYRQAAEQGHPLAQHAMASIYFAKKAPDKALKWLEKAAMLGAPEAQYDLARFYADSRSVMPCDYFEESPYPPQPALSDHWMEQAAEGGHGEAQYLTARRFMGDPNNRERAMQLLQYAAGKGHPQALHALALCQLSGNGIAQDPAAAIALLRKNRGHAPSGLLLAQLLQDDPDRQEEVQERLEDAATDYYVPAMEAYAEHMVQQGKAAEGIYWYALIGKAIEEYPEDCPKAEQERLRSRFAFLKRKHWLTWLLSFSKRRLAKTARYGCFVFRSPDLQIWEGTNL